MMKRLSFLTGFLVLSFVLFHSTSIACRFNVRDVGFVDLESDPYQLYGIVNDNTSQDKQDTLEQILFAALLDTNVKHEIINVNQAANHKALKYIPKQYTNTIPYVLLISPDERVLTIDLPIKDHDFNNNLWTIADSIVRSPLRQTLIEELIHCYGIVLLIHGKEKKENAAARDEIERALTKTKQNMGALPKDVDQPPRLLTIEREKIKEERILLWSLGYDVNLDTMPAAAVLYGRGRLMGSFLKGEHVKEDVVSNYLSVIGLNCECGLDRSWMQGKMVPLCWDESLRKQTAKQLTFDPESPMVKTEISQILTKQSNARNAGSGTSSDRTLMGYSEGSVSGMMQVESITANDMTTKDEPMIAPLSDVVTSASPIHPNTAATSDQFEIKVFREGAGMTHSLIILFIAAGLILLIGGGIYIASRGNRV